MSEDLKLAVQKREDQGTGECRRLRKAGLIPGVVYNSKLKVTPIQLDAHDFGLMLREHGENMLFDLSIDGKKPAKALLKEVQYEPVMGGILHIDLLEISMTQKLQLNIPVELAGEAVGVEAGGVLEQLVPDLEVECLPGDIVEKLEVDVSGLNIGDHLCVSDLSFDSTLTILSDPERAVAAVAAPRVEEEPEEEVEGAEGEEGEAAEPEVIGEKEEEESSES